VNPFDVADTADALHAALRMPEDERHRRAAALRRTINANPPMRWVGAQLADLERAATA
jgi:trehalose 6-phosphate synthase